MPKVNTFKKAKVVPWLQVNFTNIIFSRPHSPPVYGEDVIARAEPINEMSGRKQGVTHMDWTGHMQKTEGTYDQETQIKVPSSDTHSL